MPPINRIDKIDSYVKKLSKTEDKWLSLAIAVDIADEIMKGILPDKENWHEQLTHNSQEDRVLPDPLPLDIFKTQKQETWFVAHPILGSARVALSHFNDEKSPLESRLFWFSEKETKQKVSATTQFLSNWEDSNLTRNENYKVAIDFFLSYDTNTLMMVVTNRQKLRVMEFTDSLSNTQKQILAEKLFTIPNIAKESKYSPQESIHNLVWDAFQLKEVNNKFYQGVSNLYNNLVYHLQSENEISAADSKQFSSRLLGRLLFIWFLRKMDLINEDMGYFNTSGMSSTEYYESYLKPLFFHTLNTPISERNVTIQDEKTPYLNGGLFDIKDNDFYNQRISFPENYFERLYAHFNEFNFTVDESSVDYELVAVDPEMLGQIFESLLASQNEDDDISERKKTGSFYTPRHIVDYMCKESIRQYLYRKIDNSKYEKGIDDLIDMTDAKFIERKSSSTLDLWGTSTNTVVSKIKKALDEVKIIDPAVGSGAFPMGMLQIISKLYERILPVSQYNGYDVKLDIIENNIYGVDIQPMATEISRLRAWLAIVVDDYQDNQKIHPLPNLEFKFVSANSLVELETQGELWADTELENKLSEIRQKYFRATTTKSKNKWQKEYYDITQQTELFEDTRNEQLKTFDPFNNVSSATFYDSEFMFGVSDGFDIVLGNPPYINFQNMDKKARGLYKGLNYETYVARGDMYSLFYEKGINLLKIGGILTYITSNKWMRAGYGKKLRNYFINNSNPITIIDLGEGVFDHATVDTNILIVENESYEDSITALNLTKEDIQKAIVEDSVSVQYKQNDVWSVLKPVEQAIEDKIKKAGTPLENWNINLHRGILTGLNDAFIIDEQLKQSMISKDPKTAEIIHPILRGRDIEKYTYKFAGKYLINTHNGYKNEDGSIVTKVDIEDYPVIKGHLDKFQPKLSNRTDQGDTPYNIRNTAYMYKFKKRLIAWQRITSENKFTLTDPGVFVLDSMAFLESNIDDTNWLLAYLNSKIVYYWMKWNVHEYGSTGFRLSNQYVKLIPVPKINKLQNELIESLLENKNYHEIDRFIYELLNLSTEEIAFLEEKQ